MKTTIALMSLMVISSSVYAREIKVNCLSVKSCTREFRPAECVYKKEIRARGTNKCQAQLKIEEALCAEKGTDTVKLDTRFLKCL